MSDGTSSPKILFIDIETKLAEVYSFGIRDQHITHKQVKTHGGISCVGMKWAGERKVTVLSEWKHGQGEMLRLTREALCQADAVCHFNGANFDIPKLTGAFLVAGLPPLPPLTQIDIFKPLRRMGFLSTKLDYVAPLLGIGSKVKHEGMELWIKVLHGDEAAQRKMERYCAGDVRLTEDLYNRVKPYIATHPHLAGEACSCGSTHYQRRGYHKTRSFKTERLQCQGCGTWRLGKRSKA